MRKLLVTVIIAVLVVGCVGLANGQELENPIPNSIYLQLSRGTGDISAYKVVKIKVGGLDFPLSAISFTVEYPKDIDIVWVRNGNFFGNELAFFVRVIEKGRIRIGLTMKQGCGMLGNGVLAEIIFFSTEKMDKLVKGIKLADVKGVDINGNVVRISSWLKI